LLITLLVEKEKLFGLNVSAVLTVLTRVRSLRICLISSNAARLHQKQRPIIFVFTASFFEQLQIDSKLKAIILIAIQIVRTRLVKKKILYCYKMIKNYFVFIKYGIKLYFYDNY